MSGPAELQRLGPAARAQLIYGAARQGDEVALWRAALGSTEGSTKPAAVTTGNPLLDFQSLLEALHPQASAAPVVPPADSPREEPLALGSNQPLAPHLTAAAKRTGLPAAALAAIVDAESAKTSTGAWNSEARNPRSSAAGLGQFLSGTWLGETERAGTALHTLAASRGWLGSDGKVVASARDTLLALRADPAISIDAVADFARANLDRLTKSGVTVGTEIESVARTAWLAHHLGAGDALRFLGGGLSNDRASHLLAAQVGIGSAAQRIAAAGDASTAHRQWLLGYLDRHLRPEKFTA